MWVKVWRWGGKGGRKGCRERKGRGVRVLCARLLRTACAQCVPSWKQRVVLAAIRHQHSCLDSLPLVFLGLGRGPQSFWPSVVALGLGQQHAGLVAFRHETDSSGRAVCCRHRALLDLVPSKVHGLL